MYRKRLSYLISYFTYVTYSGLSFSFDTDFTEDVTAGTLMVVFTFLHLTRLAESMMAESRSTQPGRYFM
ncbi:hypothetical protein, partial [Ruminococcus sp.]|uniref:hypothetical protein n=1 Tax=Ruminococcus sp. TaxID=41978 RepID=UPI003AB50AA7